MAFVTPAMHSILKKLNPRKKPMGTKLEWFLAACWWGGVILLILSWKPKIKETADYERE
jgi:hypothetical protein